MYALKEIRRKGEEIKGDIHRADEFRIRISESHVGCNVKTENKEF